MDQESLALSLSKDFANVIEKSRADFKRGDTLTFAEMETWAKEMPSCPRNVVAEDKAEYRIRRKKR